MSSAVTPCTAEYLVALRKLLGPYDIRIEQVRKGLDIPGSYWGETEAGHGGHFGHGTGHGVGLEVHEAPVVGPRSKTVAREGMVFTVEPGVYLPERFGVRLEDTIVVTEDGCEALTRDVPWELDEIEALMTEPGVLQVHK